jgi:hypothetical protein
MKVLLVINLKKKLIFKKIKINKPAMPSETMPTMHGMTSAYLRSGNGKSGRYSGSTNGWNSEKCYVLNQKK